jgi:hypothetical protein
MKEVNEKKKKELNQMITVKQPELLLNINHLMFEHFGGITDGKGELTVELEVIAAAKQGPVFEGLQKAFDLPGDASPKKNHIIRQETKPAQMPEDLFSPIKRKNKLEPGLENPSNPFHLNLEAANEAAPTNPSAANSRMNSSRQASENKRLILRTTPNKVLEPGNVRRSIALPKLRQNERKNTRLGTVRPLLNYKPPTVDAETQARESKSAEVTKMNLQTKHREIEQMLQLAYVPGSKKPKAATRPVLPYKIQDVHDFRMEVLLKNVGIDIFRSIDTNRYYLQ